MSPFDIFTDAPGMLRAEASNISIKLDRTGPTSARISWNIPSPAAGCGADQRAYDGMLVTIDTTPTNASKIPSKGSTYEMDSVADDKLHAGDRLSTALVVGAFYHDTTTTFVDVTNLQPSAPYYVTGFPVDAQLRYYHEGIHAYSMEVSNRGTADTHGEQVVVINPGASTMGIGGTDATGLSSTTSYTFTIQVGLIPKPQARVDSTDCGPIKPQYTINIDGALAQTYADLVNEINKQLSTITGAPQSPAAPNTGAYYWDNAAKKLYMWDGAKNVPVVAIVQPTDPSNVSVSTYWYNGTSLQQFDGVSWLTVPFTSSAFDPTNPAVDTVWYNNTIARSWNGVTWCEQVTLYQAEDPSLATIPVAGSFWYDTSNEILYRWNHQAGLWVESDAIQYHINPNTLPNGTYWFNESNNKLFAYNTPSVGWNEQSNVALAENAPTTPAPGKFWYNPTTMDLKQWSGTAWTVLDVIPSMVDPTNRASCDVWWNTSTSALSVWNSMNNTWVTVTQLYQQGIDPTTPLPQ